MNFLFVQALYGVYTLLALTTNIWAASPLEIQAKGQIVCDQKENFCQADQEAVATQGDLTIHGDHLKVLFEPLTPASSSKRDPIRLEAKGSVHIASSGREALGNEASYDVKTGVFLLKGHPQLKASDASLFSTKPMRYCDKTGLGTAQDGLFIHHGRQCAIKAPQLHAFFSPSHQASPPHTKDKIPHATLEKILAEGGVWIVSPQHTLYAKKARYEAPHDRIVLEGDVKAANSDNLLEGDFAIVSLGTPEKVQILTDDPTFPNKRIKALLIPEKLRSSLPSSAPTKKRAT